MTRGESYTKALRALLHMAFAAGHAAASREVTEAFGAWITRHSDKRAEAVQQFLDAAVEDGYV